MASYSTAKMSSKGQIVIPEEIRKKMNLKPGSQFVVVGGKEAVVLKKISPPSMDEFGSLISEARKQAKKAGLKRSDISAAIRKARARK